VEKQRRVYNWRKEQWFEKEKGEIGASLRKRRGIRRGEVGKERPTLKEGKALANQSLGGWGKINRHYLEKKGEEGARRIKRTMTTQKTQKN